MNVALPFPDITHAQNNSITARGSRGIRLDCTACIPDQECGNITIAYPGIAALFSPRLSFPNLSSKPLSSWHWNPSRAQHHPAQRNSQVPCCRLWPGNRGHLLTPQDKALWGDWTFCSAAPVFRRPFLAIWGGEGTLTLDRFKTGPTDLFLYRKAF